MVPSTLHKMICLHSARLGFGLKSGVRGVRATHQVKHTQVRKKTTFSSHYCLQLRMQICFVTSNVLLKRADSSWYTLYRHTSYVSFNSRPYLSYI